MPSGTATVAQDLPGGAGGGRKVLVLNASYEPINVCSMRRAVVLILKQKAEILEQTGRPLRSERSTLKRPAVIRLVTYVRVPRNMHSRRITRKAVLARDSWTCQYCGERKPGMTIDHVIPRSKGGEHVWENVVAACRMCNVHKADRLLPDTSPPSRWEQAAPPRELPPGAEVTIGGQIYSDAMGDEGTPEGTYLGMVEHNVNTITEALGGTVAQTGQREYGGTAVEVTPIKSVDRITIGSGRRGPVTEAIQRRFGARSGRGKNVLEPVGIGTHRVRGYPPAVCRPYPPDPA